MSKHDGKTDSGDRFQPRHRQGHCVAPGARRLRHRAALPQPARAADDVAQQVRELGRAARVLQFDIADRQQCATILLQDIEQHACYYGVVCNAGIARDNAFPALTGEDWDSVLKTNLDGFYNVLQPLTMPMVRRRQPGRIVTLASVSGLVGNRGQVNYSAAKAGIIGATKALALELAKRDITVNCVAPGLIDTDMAHDAPLDEIVKLIPARVSASLRKWPLPSAF